MRVLVTRWFGCAVVEGDRVLERRDFPRDAHAIAERLLRLRKGEILEEERALVQRGVAVTESRLRSLGTLREGERAPAVDANGADPKLLREAALLVARDEFRAAASETDRFVVQSVRALDEVVKTVNTLMERLRDWYALHYPEAIRDAGDPVKFAKALADAPDRASVAKRLGTPPADDSIGAPFTPEELASVRSFAANVLTLFNERARLEAQIEREARGAAPTLAALIGPVIAARIVSSANGLERLAYFPVSTVQTLGAENALFLHMKEGKDPPKHGVLFQHPLVNTAPRWQRGRFARVLASAASTAAKLDFFGPGGDRSAELRPGLEQAIAGVRSRASKPPPRPSFRRGPPSRGPSPVRGGAVGRRPEGRPSRWRGGHR